LRHDVSTTAARILLVSCGAVSSVWVGLAWWRPVRGDLGFGMLFVLASIALAPALTAISFLATLKLFSSRSKSQGPATAWDNAFMVAGIALSIAGLALCLRIAYGLAFE
jgi:hypothetical protein